MAPRAEGQGGVGAGFGCGPVDAAGLGVERPGREGAGALCCVWIIRPAFTLAVGVADPVALAGRRIDQQVGVHLPGKIDLAQNTIILLTQFGIERLIADSADRHRHEVRIEQREVDSTECLQVVVISAGADRELQAIRNLVGNLAEDRTLDQL